MIGVALPHVGMIGVALPHVGMIGVAVVVTGLGIGVAHHRSAAVAVVEIAGKGLTVKGRELNTPGLLLLS